MKCDNVTIGERHCRLCMHMVAAFADSLSHPLLPPAWGYDDHDPLSLGRAPRGGGGREGEGGVGAAGGGGGGGGGSDGRRREAVVIGVLEASRQWGTIEQREWMLRALVILK